MDQIRSTNWKGSIPVIISLAPTSLSSPTSPPPLHVLVPRITFLHIGLKEAVLRFHKFAPSTISFRGSVVEEPIPGKGVRRTEEELSDDDNNSDDTKHSDHDKPGHQQTNDDNNHDKHESPAPKPEQPLSYPVCWFEDELSGKPLHWHYFAGVLYDCLPAGDEERLPWKIRLHFTQYPNDDLLGLESGVVNGVLRHVERSFKNSLKQALVLQHGNPKVALNLSKESHERLWESVVDTKYDMYHKVNEDMNLEASDDMKIIPVRLCIGFNPPVQRRLLFTKDKTLGGLLQDWIPDLFGADVGATDAVVCKVAGITPSLSTPVLELWKYFYHPDHFLYISAGADAHCSKN